MASPAPQSDPHATQWMEIFYSKPSMRRCYLLERQPCGAFAKPTRDNELVDASHIRANFRVLRREAKPMEFVLSDASGRIRDDNHGDHYHVGAEAGRYVVENGVRRVGDPDAVACFAAVVRPADRFVHLVFAADLWENCFVSFQRDGADWTPAPGVQMTCVTRDDGSREFDAVVEARRLTFAFNDGDGVWDANDGSNYSVGAPGKYTLVDGCPQYVSPTARDLAENPSGKPAVKAGATPAGKPVLSGKAVPVSRTSALPVTAL